MTLMKNCFLLLSLVLLISCSRKIKVQEAYLIEYDRPTPSSDIDIRTHYVGDAFQYITFQVDIANRSADTLFVSERDVELRTRFERSRRGNISPIRKEVIIQDLEAENALLEHQKKSNTTRRAIFSGVRIVTGVMAGKDIDGAIIDGTESATGIMEERRQYIAAQGSIEDQIAYIAAYTLGHDNIPPGASASYDVHFERLMLKGRCELVVFSTGEPRATQYELDVVKKIRQQ